MEPADAGDGEFDRIMARARVHLAVLGRVAADLAPSSRVPSAPPAGHSVDEVACQDDDRRRRTLLDELIADLDR